MQTCSCPLFHIDHFNKLGLPSSSEIQRLIFVSWRNVWTAICTVILWHLNWIMFAYVLQQCLFLYTNLKIMFKLQMNNIRQSHLLQGLCQPILWQQGRRRAQRHLQTDSNRCASNVPPCWPLPTASRTGDGWKDPLHMGHQVSTSPGGSNFRESPYSLNLQARLATL